MPPPMPNAGAPKQQWRAWAKEARQRLPTAELSAAVVQALETWPPYQQAEHVLTYMPLGAEFDLSALHTDPTKRFYLTRTSQPPARDLTIHPLTEALERHRFGYLQPAGDAAQVDPALIDLVLVPGLCFDRRGVRLGYGYGYYDRLLARLRRGALRVGVTTTPLLVPALPHEAHDVMMEYVATERGIHPTPCPP